MKFRGLSQLIHPSFGREASTCEACGGEFTCGATLAGCWCAEIKLSDATRAQLRERYKRCLCRPCLEKFAKSDNLLAEFPAK